MQISSGYEYCPRCRHKNKLRKLFTTYFYDDCDVCGKIKARELQYIMTIYVNNINGGAKIRLSCIQGSANSIKSEVKEELSLDNLAEAMDRGETFYKKYTRRSGSEFDKLTWDTEHYNRGAVKVTKNNKDGYILYRTEFKTYKIDDDEDRRFNLALDYY